MILSFLFLYSVCRDSFPLHESMAGLSRMKQTEKIPLGQSFDFEQYQHYRSLKEQSCINRSVRLSFPSAPACFGMSMKINTLTVILTDVFLSYYQTMWL